MYHDLSSGRAGIQTPNLLIRSEMLYSVELRTLVLCAQVWFGSANVKK